MPNERVPVVHVNQIDWAKSGLMIGPQVPGVTSDYLPLDEEDLRILLQLLTKQIMLVSSSNEGTINWQKLIGPVSDKSNGLNKLAICVRSMLRHLVQRRTQEYPVVE